MSKYDLSRTHNGAIGFPLFRKGQRRRLKEEIMGIMTYADAAARPLQHEDFYPTYIAGGFWQPTRTGEYAADCEYGGEVADEVVDRMTRDSNPLHLSTLVRTIVDSGRWEAVEIGFFTRLAMMLA